MPLPLTPTTTAGDGLATTWNYSIIPSVKTRGDYITPNFCESTSKNFRRHAISARRNQKSNSSSSVAFLTKQCFDEVGRFELVKIFCALADTDEAHGKFERIRDTEDDTTFGSAIELGEHDT
jgi:hypothetical protein